jgi:hypothetical protein
MKALKDIPAVRRLAAGIIWFEPPAISLRHEKRFLIYAMTHATTQELAVLRRHVPDRALRAALKAALPGIMDKRSWAYWHVMLGRAPVPPMPSRALRSAED